MAGAAYPCRVLVLRKKRLRETDMVLDLLAQDGSLVGAVAKGAAKPQGSLARLDLFAVANVMLAHGKSLEVITDARLAAAHMGLRQDIARTAAASPLLEALRKTAQPNLPVPRLFDMSCTALDALDTCDTAHQPLVCAAALIKLFAFLGLCPRFDTCVNCGNEISLGTGGDVRFSFLDGGAVCDVCASELQTVRVPARDMAWAQALLRSTFADIVQMDAGLSTAFSLLQFCNRWLRENMSLHLKSMDYLLNCGLF